MSISSSTSSGIPAISSRHSPLLKSLTLLLSRKLLAFSLAVLLLKRICCRMAARSMPSLQGKEAVQSPLLTAILLQPFKLAGYCIKEYRAINEPAVSLHYDGCSLYRLVLPRADWKLTPCRSWIGRTFRRELATALERTSPQMANVKFCPKSNSSKCQK